MNSWKNADKKKAIVEALEQQGIFFEALKEEIGKDFDPFDLICHVAFEAKPLTWKVCEDPLPISTFIEVTFGMDSSCTTNSFLREKVTAPELN